MVLRTLLCKAVQEKARAKMRYELHAGDALNSDWQVEEASELGDLDLGLAYLGPCAVGRCAAGPGAESQNLVGKVAGRVAERADSVGSSSCRGRSRRTPGCRRPAGRAHRPPARTNEDTNNGHHQRSPLAHDCAALSSATAQAQSVAACTVFQGALWCRECHQHSHLFEAALGVGVDALVRRVGRASAANVNLSGVARGIAIGAEQH
eukprot:471019-Pleurochrysis_carterae.AAC.2